MGKTLVISSKQGIYAKLENGEFKFLSKIFIFVCRLSGAINHSTCRQARRCYWIFGYYRFGGWGEGGGRIFIYDQAELMFYLIQSLNFFIPSPPSGTQVIAYDTTHIGTVDFISTATTLCASALPFLGKPLHFVQG